MIILFAKNNEPEIVTSSGFNSSVELTASGVLSDITLTAPPFEVNAEFAVDEINNINVEGAAVLYFFTLTGRTDGTTDVEIPMTSFQTRMRNTDPTYLQVVIPSVDFAQEIADRPNGTMKIDMAYKRGGEYLLRKTIVSAYLEDVMLYEGDESTRIVLVGHKSETHPSKELTLIAPNYRFINNGLIRYRLGQPNIDLRPGDTVTINDDTFTANVITYYISVERTTMEVAEFG